MIAPHELDVHTRWTDLPGALRNDAERSLAATNIPSQVFSAYYDQALLFHVSLAQMPAKGFTTAVSEAVLAAAVSGAAGVALRLTATLVTIDGADRKPVDTVVCHQITAEQALTHVWPYDVNDSGVYWFPPFPPHAGSSGPCAEIMQLAVQSPPEEWSLPEPSTALFELAGRGHQLTVGDALVAELDVPGNIDRLLSW